MPFCSAASKMLVPAGQIIFLPSMVNAMVSKGRAP
jgi:hypothetical protein